LSFECSGWLWATAKAVFASISHAKPNNPNVKSNIDDL
jgi:hypothetical protein